MSKEIYRKTDVVVDSQTGEVKEETTTFVQYCKNKEDFIFVFLNDMSGFLNIRNGIESHILAYIWKNSTKAKDDSLGNEFVLNSSIVKRMAEYASIKEQSVRNTLSSLCKKGIIIKGKEGRGLYYLNPKLFFKGNPNEREKCVIKFEYFINEKI